MKQAILKRVLKAREEKRPTVLLTHLETGAQTVVIDGAPDGDLSLTPALMTAIAAARKADRSRRIDTNTGPVFIQVFNPPLRLAIIGAVHIAQPLAPMASLAGYDVTVIDPRRAFASDERFPSVTVLTDWPDEGMAAVKPDKRTAVVALTHDPKLDDPALDMALKSEASTSPRWAAGKPMPSGWNDWPSWDIRRRSWRASTGRPASPSAPSRRRRSRSPSWRR